MSTTDSPFMTVEELAAALGIGRTLAYDIVSSGDVPVVRVGSAIRIPRAFIETMLQDALSGKEVHIASSLA